MSDPFNLDDPLASEWQQIDAGFAKLKADYAALRAKHQQHFAAFEAEPEPQDDRPLEPAKRDGIAAAQADFHAYQQAYASEWARLAAEDAAAQDPLVIAQAQAEAQRHYCLSIQAYQQEMIRLRLAALERKPHEHS